MEMMGGKIVLCVKYEYYTHRCYDAARASLSHAILGASISLINATLPMYSLSFSFGEEKMRISMFHVV